MDDNRKRPKHLAAGEYWRRPEPRITIFLGLRDAAGARRLLQRLTTAASGQKLVQSGNDFKDPDDDDGPFVGIRGMTLVVTNKEPHLRAIRDPMQAKGKWTWPIQGARQPFLLGFNPASLWVSHQPSMAHATPLAVSAAPASATTPAIRALRRKIKKVEQQRDDLDREYERQSASHTERVVSSQGGLWLALGEGPEGLSGYAAYRVPAPTLAQSFINLIELKQESSKRHQQYYERYGELRDEIREMRNELTELERNAASSTP